MERKYDSTFSMCINLLIQTPTTELSGLTQSWPQQNVNFLLSAREIPLEERADIAWRLYTKLENIHNEKTKERIRWKVLMLNLPDHVIDNLIVSYYP